MNRRTAIKSFATTIATVLGGLPFVGKVFARKSEFAIQVNCPSRFTETVGIFGSSHDRHIPPTKIEGNRSVILGDLYQRPARIRPYLKYPDHWIARCFEREGNSETIVPWPTFELALEWAMKQPGFVIISPPLH